jgi:hypothetical protein
MAILCSNTARKANEFAFAGRFSLPAGRLSTYNAACNLSVMAAL